jgi:hypothetical protein
MLVRVINLSSFFVHLITLTCYKMDNVFELELISEMGYHFQLFFFFFFGLQIIINCFIAYVEYSFNSFTHRGVAFVLN